MRRTALPLLILFLFALGACATLGLKPYGEMTPKEKVVIFFSLYNKQYEDYKIQAARVDLTDPEKQVLRQKKKILVDVYPLIQALDLSIVSGQPWDSALENMVLNLLRQLGSRL